MSCEHEAAAADIERIGPDEHFNEKMYFCLLSFMFVSCDELCTARPKLTAKLDKKISVGIAVAKRGEWESYENTWLIASQQAFN